MTNVWWSFPPDIPLHKLFKRQTVKIRYKCVPNMATAIARHNNKLLEAEVATCLVQGACRKLGWSMRQGALTWLQKARKLDQVKTEPPYLGVEGPRTRVWHDVDEARQSTTIQPCHQKCTLCLKETFYFMYYGDYKGCFTKNQDFYFCTFVYV